jgi:hypothetical protein
MMAVDARECDDGGDEGRGACPELSFRVMPGDLASGAIARASPKLQYQTDTGQCDINWKVCNMAGTQLGWEPDGTQSGLSEHEQTVQRPTIVHEVGCRNPSLY